MNLEQLKHREIGLLNTHKTRFEEYGKAYQKIREMCEVYAGPRVSEEMLISDMAYKYVEEEKRLFDLTKNEKYKLHIKAASELFRKECVSFKDILKVLEKYNRIINYEEARNILRNESFYAKINPDTLIDVLHFIEKREKNEIPDNNT